MIGRSIYNSVIFKNVLLAVSASGNQFVAPVQRRHLGIRHNKIILFDT